MEFVGFLRPKQVAPTVFSDKQHISMLVMFATAGQEGQCTALLHEVSTAVLVDEVDYAVGWNEAYNMLVDSRMIVMIIILESTNMYASFQPTA